MKLDVTTKRLQTKGLNEIVQYAQNTYATCIVENDTVYLTGAFFKCRDYFQDLVYSLHTGHDMTVYGFNTAQNPWDGKYLLCWWELSDDLVSRSLDRVNAFIVSLGLPYIEHKIIEADSSVQTNVGATGASNNLHLVEVDDWYKSTLFTASLYTAILRLVWWVASKDAEEKLSISRIFPNMCGGHEKMAAMILTAKYKNKHVWKDIMFPLLTKGYTNIGMANEPWFNNITSQLDSYDAAMTIHNSSGISCVKHTFMPVVDEEVSFADARASIGEAGSISNCFRKDILDALEAA